MLPQQSTNISNRTDELTAEPYEKENFHRNPVPFRTTVDKKEREWEHHNCPRY